MNIKPTNKEPVSQLSKNFEKKFDNTMKNYNINLNEVDELLNETELSLKKKIFSLPKMEALVFSDPKLSSVYEGMAVEGETRYGYHYNETIMNILFNDYVLNSPKYLKKYKMAIPKEKKRRDKSGINKLKSDGVEKMEKDKTIEETTTSGSAGGSASYVGYAGPAAWSKNGKPGMKKPMYIGGTVISESNYLTDPNFFCEYVKLINEQSDVDFIKDNNDGYGNLKNMSKENIDIIKNDIETNKIEENNNSNFEEIKNKALEISKKEGVVQHVNRVRNNYYIVDDNYDSDKTEISFENGRQLSETSMVEPLPDTMANTPEPKGIQSSNVEMGTNSNSMTESELLENLNKELNAFTKYHNNLMGKTIKEDRKPSAIVLKDRLGKENTKNFNDDFKNSSISDIVKLEDILQDKDNQTVITDPNKLGQDIEKEVLKKTGGKSFENVGDSTNEKGNEIPKRNLTKEEMDEIDLYRSGVEDYGFDNEPSKEYIERMKKDMGIDLYNKMLKRKEAKENAPMYNKDKQPVEVIKESYITGKYYNEYDKLSFIDFKMNNVKEINENKNLFDLNVDGLGNLFKSNHSLNEDYDNFMKNKKLFTNGKDVFFMVNENTNKTEVISESFNKMKHLFNYSSSEYIKKNKIID
jgi:hypothetical protein